MSKRLVTSLQPRTLQEICVVPLQGLLHSQGTESSPLALNTVVKQALIRRRTFGGITLLRSFPLS